MMIIGASRVIRMMILGDVTTWRVIPTTFELSFTIVKLYNIGHLQVRLAPTQVEHLSRTLH